jgi:homoserine O-acetyltransferase
MRRLTVLLSTWCALLGIVAGVASAHRPGDPPHQLYQMGDLRLENGQMIKDFAISYVTHGTLNAKKSNATLMLTALSGNHHSRPRKTRR